MWWPYIHTTLRQPPSTQEQGTSTRHYNRRQPLRRLQSGECSTPRRKTPRRRSRAEEKQVSGLVPRYLLPPSSRYVDMWWRWLRRACPHQGARHQTGTAQVEDMLQWVPTSGGRDRSSTSSAAIFFCFTAGTLIPHASPSLQTGGGTCEHLTA